MSDSPLPAIVGGVKTFLMDVLGFIGLAMGASGAAAAGELKILEQDSFRQFHDVELTPATLAELVVKGALDHGVAANAALASGIDSTKFAQMVTGTGNPPGPETLLAMERRGIIDGGAVAHGMRQGYLKDEWIAEYLALKMDVSNVGELVAGVVQNHIDPGNAAAEAAMSGVTAETFALYVANAGNPPGAMEALNLWVRGYVDESTVDQMLRESRLKNKYIEALKKLAIRKVPMRTITTLLNHGAIDDARANAMLRELGYSVEDAAAIVAAGHKATTVAHKEISAAQVRTLYADHLITRDQATADLVQLGYNPDVASQLVDLGDAEVDRRQKAAVITKLRSLYVAHHLDVAEASNRLDALLVPPDQRDRMLALWDLEQTTSTRGLSEAQVISAAKKTIITTDDAAVRLGNMGYSDGDVMILLQIAGLIPAPT